LAQKPLHSLIVGIKGAGEMASAIGWRLYTANIRKIFMMEVAHPLAVRREVSFCEAVRDGEKTVDGVQAKSVDRVEDIQSVWDRGWIAVLMDPEWLTIEKIPPDVLVDAIQAKRNLGTAVEEAPLVIGLGPGFVAGKDVHMVIETQRGHDLGKVITAGSAAVNTGVPGDIGGHSKKRVLKAYCCGIFRAMRCIGDLVQPGEVIGTVEDVEVIAEIGGVIRGLIRPGIRVMEGQKLGDIDPRGDPGYCYTISDKARAIAGSILEATLRVYNS
jgi:xanthine dehydrogenase accessory factor